VSLKNGSADEKFGNDAACAPDIDRGSVLLLAEHELWRPIPAGDNGSCVPCVFRVEAAGQPKVGNLEHAVLRKQQVGHLHVAVQDLVSVHVVEPLEHLLGDAHNFPGLEPDAAVEQPAQVVVHELKHQVDAFQVGRAARVV
jgi:hypothetical protein